jgi:hypothetical protein
MDYNKFVKLEGVRKRALMGEATFAKNKNGMLKT